MDLYDDLDTKQRPGQIDGWSSGVKLLQSQLALKKATTVLPTPVRKDLTKRSTVLAPVMLLKSKPAVASKPSMPPASSSKSSSDDIFKPEPSKRSKLAGGPVSVVTTTTSTSKPMPSSQAAVPPSKLIDKVMSSYDWDIVDEYDPLWPNDYEKLMKERRDKEHPPSAGDRSSGGRYNRSDDRPAGSASSSYRQRRANRYEADAAGSSPQPSASKATSGFGGRPMVDEEESYRRSPPAASAPRSAGVAIAPPPSLQEHSPLAGPSAAAAAGGSSVAAKIMAKYGFRDGQGLGKQEQGMSMALQVEKTSKRGGRIIHEREKIAGASALDSPGRPDGAVSPPPAIQQEPEMPPPMAGAARNAAETTAAESEPSITEIMKAPSKVVLLRNMVGPGDVDSDLEPEVKDECNGKYGEVVSVAINELHNVVAEEAVRIFVEFKRIESAIKAVVDLNGRFFGGRQVKAGFFGYDKYKANQLQD